MTYLTIQNKMQFEKNGFLCLPNFVDASFCDALINRAKEIIRNDNDLEQRTIFSTLDHRHAKSLYFLDSGDKIRCFYEENAFDADGNLKQDKLQSINKIGHALHDLDPLFNLFSRSHKIASLVEFLGVTNPLLVQSMYICKQPFIGGEVTCHQDNTYLYMDEKPVLGLWFALEDATLENGCLWAIPGAHHTPAKSRMMRNDENQIYTEVYDETPWDLSNMIPLEVKRGTLIVLHGLLPHMSKENHSAHSRHAYALHVVSNDLPYSNKNWLQRTKAFPFSGF